jgi:hypothetical protein
MAARLQIGNQIMSTPLDRDASEEELQKHADEWQKLIKLSH